MQPRTKRQREVLDYITRFIEERGYEPSYQQIARHFHISSKSAIAKHVAALENQGLLSRQRENGSFGLQINPKLKVSEEVAVIYWLEIPVSEATENDWELEPVFVPQFLLGNFAPERIFAYRVKNDAMIDEHFCEGDIVFVEKRPYARDGDVVIAIIEGRKAVLKKYYRFGANIELHPANENYQPIILSADRISIEGVVRGLLRPIL